MFIYIYATQLMRTKPKNFYMRNYQSFTATCYNGYNANKRHCGVDIYQLCVILKNSRTIETMLINIYKQNSKDRITWLCDDNWELPNQISELEKWLIENSKSLPKSDYVIDIGFDVRPTATGGGAVISINLMKLMSEKGFELYLSEYPNQLSE